MPATEDDYKNLLDWIDDKILKLHKDIHECQKYITEEEKVLNDLKKDNALTQIDIDEKTGKITREQAIEQKAEIEKQAILDKAKNEEDRLYSEKESLAIAEKKASDVAAADKAAARTASDKVNKSPEGKADFIELERLKRRTQNYYEDADKARAKGMEMAPGKEKDEQLRHARMLNDLANASQVDLESQKDKMNPDAVAASEALRKAQESSAQAKQIGEKHTDAVQTWLGNKRNSPAVTAAELSNVDIKTKDAMASQGNTSNPISNSSQLGSNSSIHVVAR